MPAISVQKWLSTCSRSSPLLSLDILFLHCFRQSHHTVFRVDSGFISSTGLGLTPDNPRYCYQHAYRNNVAQPAPGVESDISHSSNPASVMIVISAASDKRRRIGGAIDGWRRVPHQGHSSARALIRALQFEHCSIAVFIFLYQFHSPCSIPIDPTPTFLNANRDETSRARLPVLTFRRSF